MLAAWDQRYQPVADNLALSALVAALPVIVLLGLLGLLRIRAHYAALAGLATALLVALLVYGMPVPTATAALINGALFGLFPIGWIVLTAMFVYDLTVRTGQFELVKDSIAGMASDRRIQVLLIAFSFGAFLEGSAGFGTPVAICAAMLIGLGFRPLPAAGLSLIGNTAPVAFGAIGTPVLTLAGVTGLPVDTLSAMVGRQLPFFALIVPFWLVWALAGRKATFEVWPAALTAGVSFGLVQFLVSNLVGRSWSTSWPRWPRSAPCCSCSGSGNRGRSGASSRSATTSRRPPPSRRRGRASPSTADRTSPSTPGRSSCGPGCRG
jgi:lactate permease